jgi:tetratricopeptide (TPR) repeat protein
MTQIKTPLHRILLGILAFQLISAPVMAAQAGQARRAQPQTQAVSGTSSSGLPAQLRQSINQVMTQVQQEQYQQAVPQLYRLARRAELSNEQRMQLKYILGSSLLALGLPQIAAFQFAEVIKNGNSRYVRQAIEKMSFAADSLGDDTLLYYAVSKIAVDQVPKSGQDLIYFRLGEIKMRNGEFQSAISLFNGVPVNSRYGFQSQYNKGLAMLEMNRPQEAIPVFKELLNSRGNAPVTDPNRVISQLALARSYYQMKDWDNAIAQYREIPRDTSLWHDALFELSWALFRAAKFRSALSNFQSLHSSFYEDFYIPESLLLRSIVYLYICKYDEIEKVLDLFDSTYGPVRTQVNNFLTHTDPLDYFTEVEAAYNRQAGRPAPPLKLSMKADFKVLREADVKRAFRYLQALNKENKKLESMPTIAHAEIGQVGRRILGNRYKNAKISIGEMVRVHLGEIRDDLKNQYEQAEFIRYEMINGQKEQVKKKIAGKDLPATMVNEEVDRSVYVQNGFEYWPFDGEYWLDEIGTYHYFGKQSCE